MEFGPHTDGLNRHSFISIKKINKIKLVKTPKEIKDLWYLKTFNHNHYSRLGDITPQAGTAIANSSIEIVKTK